jgi:signal transduction histidine kinase
MAESKEEEKNYLGIIKSESDRLTRLINNVLDLSKMEAGRMPFEFNYVKLSKLVNASVKGLAGMANKHKHKLINNLENSSIIVLADEDKIIQVLSNILSNAIKFTSDGGVITISGEIKDNKAEISILDTGRGIKKEDYDKVFDKFQQIEDVNHHSEGTGLGMPISKIIVENHKGKIWFESKVGQGATFYFTLPIKEN